VFPASLVHPIGGGAMQINLIPDSSVSSAPAGFAAAIQAAANVYDEDFPGDYTVNITYGWGTFDNQANSELTTPGNGIASIGGTLGGATVSYDTVKAWLTTDATLSDQIAAVASLPASSAALPGDANSFYVSTSEEKALGEFTGSSSALDGAIGFNTSDASTFNFEGLALCEIGHALGWMTDYYVGEPTVLDLYRYSSLGQRQWSGGQPAYFSIDDGTTNLANFATSFDYTLFANVASNDPFNVEGVGSSTLNLTSLDTEVLNVIGFGAASETPDDFFGKGISDLLWQNTNGDNGATYTVWQSNGDNTVTPNVEVGSVGVGWSLAGVGDFNGDGETDLLWQNGASFSEWQSSGAGFTQNVDVWSVGSGWNLAGVGDFSGDGKADLILQNGTSFTEWQSTGSGFTANVNAWSVGSGWSLAAVGDFNGDGEADLIWQNGASFSEWQSNGSSFTQNVDTWSVDSGWSVVGVGDFAGNGKSDVVWENGATFSVWDSIGDGFTQNAYVGSLAAGWSVAAIGDFNGDGMSDILFRNASSGAFTEWQSTGSGFTPNVLVNSTVGTAWSLEYSPKGLA
jgi:hypothetical protein